MPATPAALQTQTPNLVGLGVCSLKALAIRTLALLRECDRASTSSPSVPEAQTPNLVGLGVCSLKALAMTYFLTGNPQYHRRNVVSRSCSGWEGVGPTRYGRQEFGCARCRRHRALMGWKARLCIAPCSRSQRQVTGTRYRNCTQHDAQGYRVKPHGQLVLVSSRHYCPYTPSLSTSWSRTTLKGSQAPGRSHLQASFPLRCFQRLSLPHIATRQCDWRHNRYTRDASTPVLSY